MAKDIKELDKNCANKGFSEEGFSFFEVRDTKAEISGFAFLNENDNEFIRLPKRLKEKVTDEVWRLSMHNSGGIIRFETNSPKLIIKFKYSFMQDLNHFARSAMNGIDVYAGNGNKKKFLKNVATSLEYSTASELIDIPLDNNTYTEITLFLPLYNHVEELYIGILNGEIKKPVVQAVEKPIAFYGSSITQGGCAQRSANCYTNMLARYLDAKILNFGFSGNAFGQLCIAEEIGKLDISLFVYDYDHNAPDIDHLRDTHYNFYKKFRELNKNTPVLVLSKPDSFGFASREDRKKVIMDTVRRANLEGDNNIYFIDGEKFYGEFAAECCSVDGVHPNDLGFFKMAEYLLPVIKEKLGLH